jgi:hypothetical protein
MKKMGGKRSNGNYKAKCDGDTTSHASNESHALKAPPQGTTKKACTNWN